jgi:putative methanogenesis marker protein 3
MKVQVNGKEKELKAGATLKEALEGEAYVKDTLIAVYLSEDKVVKETSDFELVTPRGIMVLHLDEGKSAAKWRKVLMEEIPKVNARWVTHNIAAFGSFPTDLKLDRSEHMYRTYDAFLSLGGFDNQTTYLMVARDNHKGSYGAGKAVIGRITVGRHILDLLREGDAITEVRPVMSETSTENVTVTKKLTMKLEEGYKVYTNVTVQLNEKSPESAEHLLILASDGTIRADIAAGSMIACEEDLDVHIPNEDCDTREDGAVGVRNRGIGNGRLMFYKDRRQVSPAINIAGQIVSGKAIVAYAQEGDTFTVVTNPPRALAVGLTQKAGAEFLKERGIEQVRTGDQSDDAIIVEQTPEHTMDAMKAGKVETFAVPRDRVFKIELSRKDELSRHYFRKVTGLNHKPVGSIKVQFTFEGLPMVTFYGDEGRAQNLYPQDPFKKVKRGDIGITNQARPHHGLIGIRLEDSKEYGPTGEEPYGTNIVGKFVDDLDRLMDGLEEEDVVYITEADL